jgi:hypothetical protein
MKHLSIIVSLSVILISSAVAGEVQEHTVPTLVIELEGGPLWQTINDIQIPNNSEGTRFSLVDFAGRGPYPAGRMYITWNIGPRHGLRLLLAPFSITEKIDPEETVRFEGEEFAAGNPIEATYKFNSWRMSYRYMFHRGDRFTWHIGFTAKIREAKIELASSGISSDKPDIGFVPLLHLSGDMKLLQRLRVSADLDALAGGPGRAEDFSLKLRCGITRNLCVSAGYRTLEGGADVEEVYNFAWLHYAVVSLSYIY